MTKRGPPPRITEAELIAALQAASIPDTSGEEGVYTGGQLRTMMGVGREPFTRAMRRMLADGSAEVAKVTTMRLDGHRVRVNGYRILPPAG